jgi:hypothetical protein
MTSDKEAQGIKVVAGDIKARPEGDTLNCSVFEEQD